MTRSAWHHLATIDVQDRAQLHVDVRRPGLRALGVFAALVSAVLFSALVVLLTPLAGHPTVSARADQADVAFGMPIAWVHQDQTSLDPILPSRAAFLLPQEHPTSLSAEAFLADVLVVLAAGALLFGLLVGAVRLLVARRRP